MQYSMVGMIPRESMNATHNLSARRDEDAYNPHIADFATASYFRPYATKVGIYDSDMDLIAIASLARPLKMSQKTDIYINIKLDIIP